MLEHEFEEAESLVMSLWFSDGSVLFLLGFVVD